MPAQDRLGGDEERRPTLPWHQSGPFGDKRPVRPGETRSGDVATEHSELVAEHEDLGVLGDLVHPMQPSELDDTADKAVEEAKRHGPAGFPLRSWLVKSRIRLLDPLRSR